MWLNIDFRIIRNGDSETADLKDKNNIVFGAEAEIPGRLAYLFQLPPDHTDFRVFATREEAMDSRNNGHSILQICQQISIDREAVARLLKACHFVFSESEETVVAFVRPGESHPQPMVESSVKPNPTKSKIKSMPTTSKTVSSGVRRRLSAYDYEEIDKVVTLMWPRGDDGLPLKARDRATFGGKENRIPNSAGDDSWEGKGPTTTPHWVRNHLYRAFQSGHFAESDASTLIDTATRMVRNWRKEMGSSFNSKKEILHAERVDTWKNGEYGKIWLSGRPDAHDDPGDLLLPPGLLMRGKTDNKHRMRGVREVVDLTRATTASQVRPEGTNGPQRPGNVVPFTPLDQANALSQQHKERKAALQSLRDREESEAADLKIQEAKAKEEREEQRKRQEDDRKRKEDDRRKKKMRKDEAAAAAAAAAARRDGKRQPKPNPKFVETEL